MSRAAGSAMDSSFAGTPNEEAVSLTVARDARETATVTKATHSVHSPTKPSGAEAEAAPPADLADATHETDPELLKQQLQLIPLCFAEHEFGIVVDEKSRSGGGQSSSLEDSSSDRSLSSSSSSSSSPSLDNAAAVAGSHRQQHRAGHHHYPAYDPLKFVNGKVQHGVPLPVLSQDLHSYSQYLEDRIAQCVNTDVHTAFVNVSGHLVGMREELSYMERPLSAALEKLSGAVTQLSATSLEIKEKVEAACAAEMERAFDSVYLKGVVVYETMAYQLNDLGQLLHIRTDTAASSSGPVAAGTAGSGGGGGSVAGKANAAVARKETFVIAARTRLSDAALDALEDIVMLFQELKEVQQRLVTLPSRQQERAEMATCVASAEQAVMGVLEVVLVHVSHTAFGAVSEAAGGAANSGAIAATQNDGSASNMASPAARQLLGRVIQLYSQAGEMEQFCAVFRNAVLRPPLEAVVSWKAATQARQSAEGTVALLYRMQQVLETQYLPLLPLLREHYGANLHPAARIVWPILSETLVKKLPSLYEVGIPNHFQVKYKAAYALLAVVEAACASRAELAALRQSPDVVLWNHKWNLDVYAALRVSEVDKALQSVDSPLDRLPLATDGAFHLRIFYIVHQQLLHLFSPSVYLFLCTPRFLRQAVTCCYRVLQRVQEAVAKAGAGDPGSVSTADGGEAGAATATPEVPPANDALLLAIADTHSLQTFVIEELQPVILQHLDDEAGSMTEASASSAPAANRSTAALVRDVLEFASNTVCAQFVERARQMLVHRVADAAVSPLQNIKSVRSAYSHTRKTMPAAASWYVTPALQPLHRFAEDAQRCGFGGVAREESLVAMLRAIVAQFVLLAKDTLITAKKTEMSWEKLRRRKEGGASAASPTIDAPSANGAGGGGEATGAAPLPAGTRVTMETATDRDKMTIQLWMDARALWQAVQQQPLSLPEAAASDAFAPAFELLRRAEWIQGANIPEPPDVDAG